MSSYICSAIVQDYTHFNDPGRGGSTSNCPLFDNSKHNLNSLQRYIAKFQLADQRHENEVREAEKAAIAKIRAENPGVNEDEMKVKVSEAVEKAEKDKIAKAGPPMGPHGLVPPRVHPIVGHRARRVKLFQHRIYTLRF